jgi:hypothetical protein
MTNLIVHAVDPSAIGMATGINIVTRSVGGAIGGAVFASILSSTAVRGAPSANGFTPPFTVSAVALGAGAIAALAVPGRARAEHAQLDPAGAGEEAAVAPAAPQ